MDNEQALAKKRHVQASMAFCVSVSFLISTTAYA